MYLGHNYCATSNAVIEGVQLIWWILGLDTPVIFGD